MKNTPRLSARRVLQGGTAFAALGALTLMAASPAHADTYGWAYANALGAEQETSTYITKDQTVTDTFSGSIGSWLTVEGTTTATVNSSGATGTAVVDTARIVITEADLPGILDPQEEEEEEEEKDDDTDDTDDAGDADDADDDGDDGDDDNGDEGDSDDETPGGNDDGTSGDDGEPGSGSAEPGDENSGGSDDSTETPAAPDEEPTDGPTEEPSASPAADDEDEANETASADVIELDEENSELANNGSEVLLEVTVSGASVSTSQTWDGDVSHGFDAGSEDTSSARALVDDEEVELVVDLQPATAVFESEDAGFVWNDAVTDMYITFSVEDEIVAGYLIAESAAGITTGVVDDGGDDGGDNGDGGGDDGDDKNPPQKERDEDTLPKTDPKDAEPLAQTGSPLGGLIAAGAAIAAGGGAAAYLARRKKKNGEETAETDES